MIKRASILLACFIAGAIFIGREQRAEAVPPRAPFTEFPMTVGDWKGVQEPAFEPAILAILGVDDYLTRAYFTPDRTGVGLYVGYYRSQRQGDTMHSPLNCLPGAGWEPLSKGALSIEVASLGWPQTMRIGVNRYVVQKGLDRQLVMYWYQSHGRVVASEYWSKFYMIGDAMRLNRTDGALVRVISPVAPDDAGEAKAEQIGVGFVKALFPVLMHYLPS